MQKELVISSISQETRIAVVEDGELVELLIERRHSQGIAGNIYKGRVTKVLPGMQSAFVDIGLERDAFLYVSDFLEDSDEYERMVASAEDEAMKDGDSRRSNLKVKSRTDQEKDRGRRRDKSGRDEDRNQTREEDHEETKKEQPAVKETPVTKELERDAVVTPADDSKAPRESRSRGRRVEHDRHLEDGRRGGIGGERRRQRTSKVSPSDSSGDLGSTDKPISRPKLVLPGESLAKYSGVTQPIEVVAPEESRSESEIEIGAIKESSSVGTEAQADVEDGVSVELNGETGARRDIKVPEDSAIEITVEPEAGTSIEAGPDKQITANDSEAIQIESSEVDLKVDSDRSKEGEVSSDNVPGVEATPDDKELNEGYTGRSRIIDRGSDAKFSRKTQPRRPRRRSSGRPDSGDKSERLSNVPSISELLKEGQEILVQVSKEPLGKKGARITSHIALPGRYLVYMPTVNHIGVSRKIESEEERTRLRKVIAENREDFPGGFIVRTAAEGRDEKEFIQDMRFLFTTWREVRENSDKAAAPAVIHSDLGLLERVLRDQLSEEYRAIRLNNEIEYTKILDFVSKFQPSLVNRVKLHLKNTAIFEEYGLQQEIDKALRSKVWLKSGGYIDVNQTEALVAIDVNTGKFVGKSNRLEDTIVRTNIDAVHEIVRQIRLRNLGGIIVVDFIDMEERKNRQRVMQALEEELGKDRSPSKILQFNDFGLVAITRKRTQASLERILGTPCPRCIGSGYVKAVETVCYEIQQELTKMLYHFDGDEVTIRVSPEVAKSLKSAEFVDFTELEDEFRKDIRVQSDPMLTAERFDVYE